MIMRNVARAGLLVALAAGAVAVSGCKKSGEGGGATPAAGGGKYKFAFVTNNSAGFWNIAVKGVQKAEQDLGIKAER